MNMSSRWLAAVVGVWLTVAGAGFAQGKDPAAPLPFLHGSGTAIVDSGGQPVLLRGCNLGNWLLIEPWMLGILDQAGVHDQSQVESALAARFGESEKKRLLDLYRENWITPRDFDRIKAWDFNVVRLPFHCDFLLDESRPGELKPDAFRWLDHAVSMARQAGIYVILDLHGAPGGQSLDGVTGKAGRNQFWTPENRRRGAFLWQKVAEHFAAEPTVAAYDLLNEPYGTMNNENHDADLVGAMEEMVQAIRRVDAKHLIFCAGSWRGIGAYGSPESHHWQNVGFTEHFYPGVFDGVPTLETHARFLGADLEARASLLKRWNAPYFVGEFNVVFDAAGGAAMMRRYFDVFQSHGWAGTFWSYKLLNREGGVHPNHWYMLTNRQPLTPPNFAADSVARIEEFCRSLGTMDYAEADDLHAALGAKTPPPLLLGKYTPVVLPDRREPLPGWTDADIGGAFPEGGSTVVGPQQVQVFGGGRDVYEINDDFHFVSRPAETSFRLQAEVGLPVATHIHAKAGLMFRASNAPDAPLVMINLKPGGQCIFGSRTRPGAKIVETQVRFDAGACTLRLTRHGAAFEASALDRAGTVLGTRSVELPDLPTAGVAGLFVLSHDAMQLSEATFGKVKYESPADLAPTAKP